jgi:hypothetical protein
LRIHLTTIGLVLLLLLSSGATSQGSNWLEQGKKLLDTYQKGQGTDSLSIEEIGQAFKEALQIGADGVVDQLGKFDGFNADPAIRIPLPEALDDVKQALGQVGLAGPIDDLEVKLNRAAEAATPKAKTLFWEAIEAMTFDDVRAIYEGPKDAATRYFRQKMSPQLAAEMRPIVSASLKQVGAVQAYDYVLSQYRSLPFAPAVEFDPNEYVVEKGMDGIFYYLAREEAAIRSDPAKQTTALLKRVFGSK